MTTLRTTCPYCGVGCGVSVADGDAARRSAIIPPISAGCAPRARRCKDTLALPDRLTAPMMRGREASWDAGAGSHRRGVRAHPR